MPACGSSCCKARRSIIVVPPRRRRASRVGSILPLIAEPLPRKFSGFLGCKRTRDPEVTEVEAVPEQGHELAPLPATLAPTSKRRQKPPAVKTDEPVRQNLRHSGRHMIPQRFQPHAKRCHEVSVPPGVLALCAVEDRGPFHECAIAVGDRRDPQRRHEISER